MEKNNFDIKENEKFIFSVIPTKDIIIKSGEGCTLQDIEGNKYLDLGAGLWCSILGFSNKEFINTVIDQTKNIIHLGSGIYSKSIYEAAQQISSITPGNLNKVILLCTGSEATECALKISNVYTDKFEIVGMERGYFGITFAAQSASGFGSLYGMEFPRMVGSHKILAPYCYRCPVSQEYPDCSFLCLEVSKKLIDANTSGKIAAFIFEPILAAGGVIIPPKGYFKRLKEIADEYNALLIVDEVSTGIGRTGKWFGIEHYDIIPDILFMSKTLGGGIPVAAVVTSPQIEMGCQRKSMIHVQSHMFDPLPASAAQIVIKQVKEKKLVENSKQMGEYTLSRLMELKEIYDIIGDVRGKGLMIGIEIVDPKTNKINPKLGKKIEYELQKHGIIVSFSTFTSVFRVFPPLIIEKEEIDYAIDKLHIILHKIS